MRFCMVTTFYPPYHFGGDAIFVQALARALVSEGHHVEVVHCEDAYHLRAREQPTVEAEQDGVVVHRLRSAFGSLSPLITQQTGKPGVKMAQLRAVIDRDFDVVNFHNISLIGGPGVLRMSTAPVTLYTLHEHWLLCPMHFFWKNRERACDRPQCVSCCVRSAIPPQLWRYTNLIPRSLAHVDALLSPSEFTALQHRAAGLPVPIHVVPTFSNLDPGQPKQLARDGRPRFLFVGRVTASKGIAALLEAFVRWPEYDLDVVGDGDLRQQLEAQYAVSPHIRFLGPLKQPELIDLYQQATAFILPSLAPEVFPLTVLEAMACGTPSVVHDAGGSREAVERSRGGFVYRTPEELKQILSTLAGDDALRHIIAGRARAGYEQFYTREHYLARYLGLVDTIRSKKGLVAWKGDLARQSDQRMVSHSRGPAGYPFVGHLPGFLCDRLGFLSRCAAEHGDVVKLHIGEPTFLLNHPDDIKHVLVMNPDNYVKSPRMTSVSGKRLSGSGLLTSVGGAHLKQRRMMQPVFYRKTVESFSRVITAGTGDMLAQWSDGMELDFGHEIMALVQQNIVRTVLGSDADDMMPELLHAISIRRLYMEHVFFSPLPEWVPTRIGWAYRKAMRRIDDVVCRAIQVRRAHALNDADMLSLLIRAKYDDGRGMTDQQVRDEAVTLFVTGYETIGEAITWTSFLLAQHSEVEAKFLTEVDKILGGRIPSAEDLPNLPYTAKILAESMRLYPPTWIFIRMALQEDKLPTGATIPAGAKLYLSPYVMQRNPRYFPAPDRFDPERFTETAKNERPPVRIFSIRRGSAGLYRRAFRQDGRDYGADGHCPTVSAVAGARPINRARTKDDPSAPIWNQDASTKP